MHLPGKLTFEKGLEIEIEGSFHIVHKVIVKSLYYELLRASYRAGSRIIKPCA
jgi:hypothetical protein